MSGHSSSPPPATSASAPHAAPGGDPIHDMASQIYVRLVTAAIDSKSASATSLPANADGLARLSIALAEKFAHAADDIKASAAPKTAVFDIDKMDFGV